MANEVGGNRNLVRMLAVMMCDYRVRPRLALYPGYVPFEACDLGDGGRAVILDFMNSRVESPRSLQAQHVDVSFMLDCLYLGEWIRGDG